MENAAVHVEDYTGDVARGLAGQEGGGFGDVFGPAGVSHRDLVGEFVACRPVHRASIGVSIPTVGHITEAVHSAAAQLRQRKS
jgi:hypothetical protein